MFQHRTGSRPARRRRRSAPLAVALALAAGMSLGAIASCGGAQGIDAPEPDAPQPNACTDVKLVMPGFFALLADPDKPLDGLRQAVRAIGTPVCLDKVRNQCTADTTCPIGDCGADGLCPCQNSYSPLADLLVISFRGLAGIASTSREPDAPAGSFCESAAQAAQLQPSQINRTCEIRRMLDVLLQQNGGKTLLNDPNVQKISLDLLRYIEGKTDGVPHYDLFTTLGRMAQNPGVCSPADAYDLLDKALAYFTPAKAASDLGAIQDLLADPQTKKFLAGLSTGGSAQGRQSLITLAHDLIGTITSAQSGEAATQQIDKLLSEIVYPYIEKNYGTAYENKVKAAAAALEGAISTPTGIFPFLQRLLVCANNPVIDNNGELVGALYDLISLQSKDGSTIDLSTLVGALKTLITLDGTGQVSRSLRMVIQGARNDDAATEAVRALLAQVLTPEIAQKLLPPLDVLVQKQVLIEVITLLDDLFYKCTPPPPH